jgi:hypothetical protein
LNPEVYFKGSIWPVNLTACEAEEETGLNGDCSDEASFRVAGVVAGGI